jgi:RNA polymerase sigma factor (sigma-70 family)
MFPTTVWTRIGQAGAHDEAALEEFAERYRPVVLGFIRSRGPRDALADDLCQEVFLKVLHGDVLARADRNRGRFRSLLLTITMHVLHDHFRKRRDVPAAELEPARRDPEFDHAWALNLAERAMDTLREQGSPYYDVLRDHLHGQPQARNRLWIARRKLGALIRREVAMTCADPRDAEEELAYLSQFLRPAAKD